MGVYNRTIMEFLTFRTIKTDYYSKKLLKVSLLDKFTKITSSEGGAILVIFTRNRPLMSELLIFDELRKQ